MSLRKIDPNSVPVYSTDPRNIEPTAAAKHLDSTAHSPRSQVLKLRLETKGRGGKAVTVITGLSAPGDAAENLARMLKSLCGAGGTVKTEGKESEIEVQGDHRPKIAARLRQMGFIIKGA